MLDLPRLDHLVVGFCETGEERLPRDILGQAIRSKGQRITQLRGLGGEPAAIDFRDAEICECFFDCRVHRVLRPFRGR
ncbi:MAG: hypothetical protein LWW93_11025 [Hyphomicrobiales bacterium]|nr:hypothetical protein [Hyphomicrobiales bacterium]